MSIEQEIIAQKLTEYIRRDKDETEGNGYFQSTLAQMSAQKDNTFNRPVASAKPGVGSLVVVFKKVIRRIVAWYNNPFAQQQSAFNTAAVDSVTYLGHNLCELQQQNRILAERLEKMEAEVWRLKHNDKEADYEER